MWGMTFTEVEGLPAYKFLDDKTPGNLVFHIDN